jgi:hypothetical protein
MGQKIGQAVFRSAPLRNVTASADLDVVV